MNRRHSAPHERPHTLQYSQRPQYGYMPTPHQPYLQSEVPGHVPCMVSAWYSGMHSVYRENRRPFHPWVSRDLVHQSYSTGNIPGAASAWNLHDICRRTTRKKQGSLSHSVLASTQRPNTSVSRHHNKSTTSVNIASDRTAMREYYRDRSASPKKLKKSNSSESLMTDSISIPPRTVKDPLDTSKLHPAESDERLCRIGQQIEGALRRREHFSAEMEVAEVREGGLPNPSTQVADDSTIDETSLVIDIPEEDLQTPKEESTGPSLELDSTEDIGLTKDNDAKSEVVERTEETSLDSESADIRTFTETANGHKENQGVGKFKCKKCPLSFQTINQLFQHTTSCKGADDKSQRSCKECSTTFPSKKAFLDHWKEYHCADRKHECMKCGRRFTVERALEIHSWTHK